MLEQTLRVKSQNVNKIQSLKIFIMKCRLAEARNTLNFQNQQIKIIKNMTRTPLLTTQPLANPKYSLDQSFPGKKILKTGHENLVRFLQVTF